MMKTAFCRVCLMVIAAAVAWPGGLRGQERPGANPVANGSFEESAQGGPEGWRRETWAGSPQFEYARHGRTGERSVGISASAGADAAWVQTVRLEPYWRYRLSAWVRTEGLAAGSGRGALLNLHTAEVRTPAITGTQEWTRVQVEFDNYDERVQVNCLFGGWGQSTGRAWFDDVQLEKVREIRPSSETIAAEVRLDAGDTGAPISELIYGQFIEHLGRCIYGGIWAEMLEDRKFYYPITADYDPYVSRGGVPKDSPYAVVGRSPWKILGDAAAVEMVAEDSFVGEHTPRLGAGVAIAQYDLGVVRRKDYEGYIWLRAPEQAARVRVSLAWGADGGQSASEAISVAPGDYAKYPFRFTAGASTDEASLTIAVEGAPVFVGTVSIMPADNVRGMRADTLALLKELDSPIYRWPGGNFVSGYDWRDGLGDRDRRPPRTNPAWTGVEHNDFGMHEFIDFCRELDTEPMIAVNTGFEGVFAAQAEVEYANGAVDTPWGARRAANGHPEPFDVTWWCVGNEMFGNWQLGYMQLNQYVLKHNWVAQAMWDVDPTLKLIGVGELGGNWSRGMLEHCADYMDAISEHFYVGRELGDPAAHAAQMVDAIRNKANGHRELQASLELDKIVPIAMDEWNYWYHDYEYGELGCIYRHRDALGIAAGLHEYFRNSDIIVAANYAQTVNVIGCIKTTRTEAFLATTALPLILYRGQFGEIPIEVEHDAAPLDVVAAWTADRDAITVAIVNPSWNTYRVKLAWDGARPGGATQAWRIAAADPLVYNTPEQPENVSIEEIAPADLGSTLDIAPLSNVLYRVPVQ